MEQSLFIVNKNIMLESVRGIYESLIDISSEIDTSGKTLNQIKLDVELMKKNIGKLVQILKHDIVALDPLNVSLASMTVDEWNAFIEGVSTDNIPVGQRQCDDEKK